MASNNIELTSNNNLENKINKKIEYKLYKKRWLILILFIFYSISNRVQFIEFSVIAHIITEYYQVSYGAVDWTTMVSSVVYVSVSIPGAYVIDKIGIRKTVIIGIIGTCLGSWIKVLSVHPDRFWLIILGQGIVAAFQICIYPLLPKLAATWFGHGEVSTACGIGYIGSQVGHALSFVLPPLIVSNGEIEEVTKSLYILNIGYATYATIMVPLLIIFLTDTPPSPPSIAQQYIVTKKHANAFKGFFETCKTIMLIKPYMLYLIIFGVNAGITTPLQILSNQIILSYYSDADYDVGVIGLLQTLLSLIGTMITAIVLDKYGKYRITCWVVHILFFSSLLFYIGTMDQGLEFVYISSIFIGICSGAGVTLAFELIVEFTYPHPQSICAGLVFNWMEMVSLSFTLLSGHMLRSIGFLSASLTMVTIIFLCDLLLFFLKFDLRRKTVQNSQNKPDVSRSL